MMAIKEKATSMASQEVEEVPREHPNWNQRLSTPFATKGINHSPETQLRATSASSCHISISKRQNDETRCKKRYSMLKRPNDDLTLRRRLHSLLQTTRAYLDLPHGMKCS